jgi:hypothetical protein
MEGWGGGAGMRGVSRNGEEEEEEDVTRPELPRADARVSCPRHAWCVCRRPTAGTLWLGDGTGGGQERGGNFGAPRQGPGAWS